jgi:hypothetical protein
VTARRIDELFAQRRCCITIQQILMTTDLSLGLTAARFVNRTQQRDENPEAAGADMKLCGIGGLAAYEHISHFGLHCVRAANRNQRPRPDARPIDRVRPMKPTAVVAGVSPALLPRYFLGTAVKKA